MSLSRRVLIKGGAVAVAGSSVMPGLLARSAAAEDVLAISGPPLESIEQWSLFEASFTGPHDANPFSDVEFGAAFKQGGRSVRVTGFYDGDGVYRVRFMPEAVGEWSYRTDSNCRQLDGHTGSFTAQAPSAGNHGPVRVEDMYHFRYADSSSYRELGTTCYAWVNQREELQDLTLQTLGAAPFNKLRMLVLPKWMVYNRSEPLLYPFAGTGPHDWDFTRLNPAYFQLLEQRIGQLQELGIQADVILFHPYDYDHWGFDRMGAENDDRYLRYVLARLAAYRNVWWSLANEWDFVKSKDVDDWERFGLIVKEQDPYSHLCSIHNGAKLFDHTRPWITHVSLQKDQPEDAPKYLDQYRKPVIYDECRYEGDIPEGWGDITAARLVGCFWKTLIAGAFCGHGGNVPQSAAGALVVQRGRVGRPKPCPPGIFQKYCRCRARWFCATEGEKYLGS